MKSVTYKLLGGGTRTVEYDENAPCRICGLPVVEASMGGTNVCPWCDCGKHRDGTKWTLEDFARLVPLRVSAGSLLEAEKEKP